MLNGKAWPKGARRLWMILPELKGRIVLASNTTVAEQ